MDLINENKPSSRRRVSRLSHRTWPVLPLLTVRPIAHDGAPVAGEKALRCTEPLDLESGDGESNTR